MGVTNITVGFGDLLGNTYYPILLDLTHTSMPATKPMSSITKLKDTNTHFTIVNTVDISSTNPVRVGYRAITTDVDAFSR